MDINNIINSLKANGYSEEQINQFLSQAGLLLPATTNAAKKSGLGGMFSGLTTGLRGKFGAGKSLLGEGIDLSALKHLGSDIRATNLWEGGPTVAQGANTLSGLYQGMKAFQGLDANMKADKDLNSLKSDINLQIASNPMYDMYMDAEDEKLLRQIRNNSLTDNWNNAASGAMEGIPQAALAAIMGGVTGGVPGAIIGGAGSLINSGIQGYGRGTEEANAKLQGLYDRLRQANEEYRTMKRPSGLRQAGLSRQYYNQLY